MADPPVLVVVNGIPGTGKTTLSRKLSKDLALPCINKDDIKEFLFDKLGVGDLKWSQDLGAGVADMLYAFIDAWIGRRGRSLIVENAFFYEFARPYFESLLSRHKVVFIEIYCKADGEVRKRRFIDRNESGQRHPGHVDHHHYAQQELEAEITVKYAPINLGDIIEVDTTSFDKVDYAAIVSNIQQLITRHYKEKQK